MPRLSPAVDGVGDYALRLAESLRDAHGITTVFLVAERLPAGRRAATEDGFAVVELEAREPEHLARELARLEVAADFVLLHYVGYGYREGGRPVWLLRGVQAWRRRSTRPLLVFFHELFAVGRPWRRAFWTSFAQRRIFEQLVALADAMATSTRAFARTIERHNRRRVPLLQQPIPSNIGEPAAVPAWPTRANQLVIFGGVASRAGICAGGADELRAFCAVAKIERVIDVGPGAMEFPSLPCALEVKGVLAAREVSALLLASRYGGVSGPAEYFAKSGVFAAYASHGVIPVQLDRSGVSQPEELSAGVHYATPVEFNVERAAVIADNVHRWYAPHAVARHAEGIAGMVGEGARQKAVPAP